jgi:hypothetical protein
VTRDTTSVTPCHPAAGHDQAAGYKTPPHDRRGIIQARSLPGRAERLIKDDAEEDRQMLSEVTNAAGALG